MAEILIKARDHTHPDPIKDQRGAYKRGMPVVVMPDGHEWGASEDLPAFVVLRLPGISVERVQQFLEPIEVEETVEGQAPRPRMIRRRLWQISWADLPAGARSRLESSGALTIAASGGDYTWAQIRNFLKRFDTGASAPASL
jgi:hypothetical protein